MDGFKKFLWFLVKELLLYNRMEAFSKLLNQVSKRPFYTFEDIDLLESHARLHKKLSETLGGD